MKVRCELKGSLVLNLASGKTLVFRHGQVNDIRGAVPAEVKDAIEKGWLKSVSGTGKSSSEETKPASSEAAKPKSDKEAKVRKGGK